MKKMLVSILLILSMLVVTTPAAAAEKVRVGERIILFTGEPTTFTAGAPFHIAHGWIAFSDEQAIGVIDFKLQVDGVYIKEDFVERSVISGSPDEHNVGWVFNFPTGMTGEHTFIGHWFGPCQELVNEGYLPGPCPKPNEKLEAFSRTVIVTFVEP